MKRLQIVFFLALVALAAKAQDHFVTANSNNTFTPSTLTISAGETVQWSNTGGFHNVNGSQAVFPGNPEGFSSGNASSAAWVFSHTFTIPGVYQYQCDPHVGLGMNGTVVVEAASAAESDLVITEINYNNPGIDDYEFLELYNRGSAPLDLTGYQVTSGFVFTFPPYTLEAGGYVVIAVDAALFSAAFPGVDVFEMESNNLNNSGEKIQIEDALGNVMDSLTYRDGNGWPSAADGQGPSLVLCDADSDNSDPASWQACFTPSGFIEPGGAELIVNPGAASQCITGPVVGFVSEGVTVLEDVGTVSVEVYITNGNAQPTTVEIIIDPASSAGGGDIGALPDPLQVTFAGGVADGTQSFDITITDDLVEEGFEDLVLTIVNADNGALIAPLDMTYTLTIQDDDIVNTGSLLITGVFDAQPSLSGTKGFELKALEDIPDLSIYGVSSANNGTGGTGLPEFTFPAVALSAGSCVYVADDSTKFFEFFGFYPDFVAGAASINGDDAIELFENGFVIDVFGDVNVDGSGEPWEYLDGWVYRKDATGPDGSTFILDNWIYSGVDALEGVATNTDADQPFPVCSYLDELPDKITAFDDLASTSANNAVSVDVLANDFIAQPPLTILSVLTISVNGTAVANGLSDITYTPAPDFCGQDFFVYEICDGSGCDTAMVTMNVACPPAYPVRPIGTISSDSNGDFVPDSLGRNAEIRGVVHSPNFRPGDLEFFLIDGSNDGIAVFSFEDLGYTVMQGDSLHIKGIVTQFNGLNQFSPVEIELIASGRPLFSPTETNVLDESTEAQLIITQTAMSVVSSTPAGGGVNYLISDGTDTLLMRVDSDVNIGTIPPSFKAIGVGSQFDTDTPYDDGYQFLPRGASDIIPVVSTQDLTPELDIRIWPNPVSDWLSIESNVALDRVVVRDLFGRVMMHESEVVGLHRMNLSALPAGTYLVNAESGLHKWSSVIVKK
jgi:plastocyanin